MKLMNDDAINRMALLLNEGGNIKEIWIDVLIDKAIADPYPIREWRSDDKNGETFFKLHGSASGGIFDGIKFDKDQVDRIIAILMEKKDG